ncbi:hypothetical protein, partial [Enterocloster lavalensis]|uniref:hypothetical protein n=1 Tax=Enterocloster lavalensis TaxID=460384 RepID=UPI002FDA68C1
PADVKIDTKPAYKWIDAASRVDFSAVRSWCRGLRGWKNIVIDGWLFWGIYIIMEWRPDGGAGEYEMGRWWFWRHGGCDGKIETGNSWKWLSGGDCGGGL